MSVVWAVAGMRHPSSRLSICSDFLSLQHSKNTIIAVYPHWLLIWEAPIIYTAACTMLFTAGKPTDCLSKCISWNTGKGIVHVHFATRLSPPAQCLCCIARRISSCSGASVGMMSTRSWEPIQSEHSLCVQLCRRAWVYLLAAVARARNPLEWLYAYMSMHPYPQEPASLCSSL